MMCDSGKFWLGLGLGSALGILAYHCSRTARGQQVKAQLLSSLQDLEVAAEEALVNAKHKTRETGANIAGKVAEKALHMKEILTEEDL